MQMVLRDRLVVSLVSTLLLTPERGLVHYPEACGQRRVVSDVDVTHRTLVNRFGQAHSLSTFLTPRCLFPSTASRRWTLGSLRHA